MDEEQFRQRYRVKTVRDESNNQLSPQEAIDKGVIDLVKSQYVDKTSGRKMSIYEAINKGLVIQLSPLERIAELRQSNEQRYTRRMSSFARIRTTTTEENETNGTSDSSVKVKTTEDIANGSNTSPEPKGRLQRSYSLRDSRRRPKPAQNSMVRCFYGLITFQTKSKICKYRITSAIDTRSGEDWPYERAKYRGVIDVESEIFIDTKNTESLTFAEALNHKFIKIDVFEEAVNDDVDEDHYVVYGVMDLLEQRRITFKEAIDTFVLVRDPALYRDTLNHLDLTLDEAIKNKLVVAKFVNGQSHSLYDSMISEDNRLQSEREKIVYRFADK